MIGDLNLRPNQLGDVLLRGKGRKVRRCPLWPATVNALLALVRNRSPAEPVFLNRLGDAITRHGTLSVCKERIEALRRDENAPQCSREIQQLFGDVFVCAGYFLGHLEAIELDLKDDAPRVSALLQEQALIDGLFTRLRCVLQELWLSEFAWKSIDVFVPIYDLICEMMALHGLSFVRHEEEWRLVITDA